MTRRLSVPILAMMMLAMAIPMRAQTPMAPYFGTGMADDSIGTKEYVYNGYSRVSTLPLLRNTVPGSALIGRTALVLYLKKGARSADTVVIEQRIITSPDRRTPEGVWLTGDTSWQRTTYLNMQTGALDTTGTVILGSALVKIQVYDPSPGAWIRIRTTTLRPSAERVTYNAY